MIPFGWLKINWLITNWLCVLVYELISNKTRTKAKGIL
jgi:hypothetical protein